MCPDGGRLLIYDLVDTGVADLNPRTAIDDNDHRLPHVVEGANPTLLAKYEPLVRRCPGGLPCTGYTVAIGRRRVTFNSPFGGSGFAISFVDAEEP